MYRYRSNPAPLPSPAARPAIDTADIAAPLAVEDSGANAALERKREQTRERVRRHRERKRQGVRIVPLEIGDDEVDSLLESGDLTEQDEDDPARFNDAINRCVKERLRGSDG
jgi:hypothetical protein